MKDLKRVREQKQIPLLISLADSTQQSADYFLEGTINGAGSAIKWAAKSLKLESVETRLDAFWPNRSRAVAAVFQLGWRNRFANLERESIRQSLLIAGSTIVLGRFQQTDLQANEAMVGVLESIVFLVAMNIDSMRELGVESTILRLSGGVTASRSLCQKFADLTRCRCERPNESESTLLGVARLLAEPSVKSELLLKKTSTKETFEPRSNPQLQQRYQLFQKLILEKIE